MYILILGIYLPLIRVFVLFLFYLSFRWVVHGVSCTLPSQKHNQWSPHTPSVWAETRSSHSVSANCSSFAQNPRAIKPNVCSIFAGTWCAYPADSNRHLTLLYLLNSLFLLSTLMNRSRILSTHLIEAFVSIIIGVCIAWLKKYLLSLNDKPKSNWPGPWTVCDWIYFFSKR